MFTTPKEPDDRILAIAKILSDGKSHKAVEIARTLGVHSRTIRRSLHYMRDELKLPIESSREGFRVENRNVKGKPAPTNVQEHRSE